MKKLLSVLIIMLASACTSKVSYLSVVVPEGQTFTYQDLNYATVRKNVTATDRGFIFLLFPLGYPDFEIALKKALGEGRGNVMTNVTVIEEMDWYILFGINRIELSGDVINTQAMRSRVK